MEIGRNIRKVRKKQGMKLRELSEKIGLSISFLSDIENGRSNPSVNRLESIAEGLGTSVAYLLEGCGSMHKYDADELKALVMDICREYFSESDLVSILKDPEIRDIIPYFSDYEDWTKSEKRELITYLKVKREMRESGGKRKEDRHQDME